MEEAGGRRQRAGGVGRHLYLASKTSALGCGRILSLSSNLRGNLRLQVAAVPLLLMLLQVVLPTGNLHAEGVARNTCCTLLVLVWTFIIIYFFLLSAFEKFTYQILL